MRGHSGWWERDAEPYAPYIGHVSPAVILLDDGSLLAMGRLRGVPHELAAASERNATARLLNGLWRNIADETVTICAHFVRHRHVDKVSPAVFRNTFSEDFARAYKERVLEGKLYQNDWFLTIIASPRVPIGGQTTSREVNRRLARFRKRSAFDDYSLNMIEDLWTAVTRPLDGHHVRRLGFRENDGVIFSEIAEALRLILYCEYRPVPLVCGRLGLAIYDTRVVFGRQSYAVTGHADLPNGGAVAARFGAIFGLREYMATTRPGMLDELLPLPMSLVISQSFGFLARPAALGKLGLKANQMAVAGDKATSQIESLARAQDQLASGEFVMGMHHLSIAVYGETYAELERAAGIARAELANAGAVVAQELLGNEAAFFAQLPGNLDWRTRPGAISSRNFSHLANFGAFPRGSSQSWWGAPMLRFKTTAGTPYDYAPHVDDVGMTAIFGRTGSGKSTLLTALLAMFDQYMVERDGIIVFFDKDRGAEIVCRAVGGNYLVVRSGEESGLAPLRGFGNTPYARNCLSRWLKTLIELDGHGPLPPEDSARVARGVAAMLRMPRAMRTLLGLRQFLGWRNPLGAGRRLERWCRGRSLGWAFDSDDDLVDFNAPVVGVDLTAILESPEIVEPAAQYLRDRIRPAIDGRRAVISFDEARAYMLSPAFEAEIKDFLLTLRKQNGIVLLSTQHPEDLLGGAFGASLVGSCHTQMYFPSPTADEEVYREKLYFTAGELDAIREKMLPGSRRILIKRRGGGQAESVIVDFDLGALPEYVAVLSGRASTVQHAERLRAAHENQQSWVKEYMATYAEARD